MTTTLQPLVGRDSELQVLEQLLEDARRGLSRFVVVSGEPEHVIEAIIPLPEEEAVAA